MIVPNMMVSLSASLADPVGSNALGAAVLWVEATLLGTFATTLAIVAVALLGFAMLNGRIHYRRGATVILGCFVLFGAKSIASGLVGIASGGAGVAGETAAGVPESPLDNLAKPPASPPRAIDDPYAGASVIRQGVQLPAE